MDYRKKRIFPQYYPQVFHGYFLRRLEKEKFEFPFFFRKTISLFQKMSSVLLLVTARFNQVFIKIVGDSIHKGHLFDN
jgi:hypothetical protein